MSENFGPLNGHAIGTIIKSAMMRAMQHIHALQFTFESRQKKGYEPDRADFVTDADKGAQKVYEKLFRESFPDFGIVAEEDGLSVSCTHSEKDIWMTVDPLDGTKAFIRGQSHGVGTMVSLVCDGEIIAAYVGDVMTGEIYGYRPGSDRVWRINRAGRAVELRADWRNWKLLRERYVLLRDAPWEHSRGVLKMVVPDLATCGPLFKSVLVDGGSIGIGMARLWKGEVGAAIVLPSAETPWDANPVMGINRRLGFLNVDIVGGKLSQPYRPKPVRDIVRRNCETLIVHESHLKELRNWLART